MHRTRNALTAGGADSGPEPGDSRAHPAPAQQAAGPQGRLLLGCFARNALAAWVCVSTACVCVCVCVCVHGVGRCMDICRILTAAAFVYYICLVSESVDRP
jgi:hypothetical protein